MAERHLKILLSAYACEPGKGSEPGVGWGWAKALAPKCHLAVLTRANNKPAIESVMSTDPWVGEVEWLFYDPPQWLTFWKKKERGVQLFYYIWQMGAWLHLRNRGLRERFDLVHHVTFGKYWVGSWLVFLGLPLVFGPVGGGEDIPEGLKKDLPARGRYFETLRSIIRILSFLDPALLKIRFSRKVKILVATAETKKRLPGSQIFPQCFLDEEHLACLRTLPRPKESKELRIAVVSRLVYWKGIRLALEALGMLKERNIGFKCWIVNEGPDRKSLENLCVRLGLTGNVVFLGRLESHAAVWRSMADADVLFHPALHEAFGNAILETLAIGRPVVCLRSGGPGLQVDENVGIAVPAGTWKETTERLAEALEKLACDPVLRSRLGAAASVLAQNRFSASSAVERILTVYNEVLGRNVIDSRKA